MNEITAKLDRLAELRQTADATRIDFEKKRAEILKSLQPQLDALDAEFTPLLETTQERIEQLESEIRAGVLQHGATVRGKFLRAVFARGRIAWDTKGLDTYAQQHPEVTAFRHQGEPYVSLVTERTSHSKDTA